jgi:hypothetical protein
MANIFVRGYQNTWGEAISGCFTVAGGLGQVPQNPPAATLLLFAILRELHTGQALQKELDTLQRKTGCDRSDLEALQILTSSLNLPVTIFLTGNIVNANPN